MSPRQYFALALAVGLALPPTAFAAGPSFRVDSGDRISGVVLESSTDGNTATPVGTSANPLVVTGAGGGGSAGSITAAGTNGTQAQAVQGITGGVPVAVTTAPTSASAVACQGGTGSNVTSVTTTAATVCAATTGARSYFNVMGTSGTYGGTVLGGCTLDGSTPTSTAYDYALFGAGSNFNSAGLATIPNGAITCVAFAGTLTIRATAIQSGTAP